MSPQSPAAPSRVPSTPTSSSRAPKRLQRTPNRQPQTPKRLPSTPKRLPATPQQPMKPMTPKRNPKTTPRISRPDVPDDSSAVREPKRCEKTPVIADGSKKRKVRDLASKVTSTSVPSTKLTRKSNRKIENPTEEDADAVVSSASQKKLQQKKKRRLDLAVGGIKKERSRTKSENEAEFRESRDAKSSESGLSNSKRAQSLIDIPEPKLNDHGDKKQSKSIKQREANREIKASSEKDTEQDGSKRKEEEITKKLKPKKKRPTPGKFDLPAEPKNPMEMSSAKLSKKRTQVGDERALLSPKITVNDSMTESKLKLLESSPLNRLIAEKDRRAAAAEVAAQKKTSARKGKKRGGLSTSDPFVPLEKTEDEELDSSQRDGKKEARKLKSARKEKAVLADEKPPQVGTRGVMYLGHIPHGFFEKEMRSYFSQFGTVTQLKLSRSRKTGGSRGYAFLEFADPSVASIAAEAMDGYLMHGQSLVAKVVPEEKVHPDTFKGADKKFKKIPWSSIGRRKMIARAQDPLKLAVRSSRVRKVTKKRMKRLSQKGIKYDFPELPAKPSLQPLRARGETVSRS